MTRKKLRRVRTEKIYLAKLKERSEALIIKLIRRRPTDERIDRQD